MAITQSTDLLLEFGLFTIAYHATEKGDCVSVRLGDMQNNVPIVRLHSSCLFGESFHALGCDCSAQLTSALKLIQENGAGVVVYSYAEGRGVGLENKIQALELQRTKRINTVEAFELLGFKPDVRIYEAEFLALQDLPIQKRIKVATQNPRRLEAFREAGYDVVEEVHPRIELTDHNLEELMTKKELLGYHIGL